MKYSVKKLIKIVLPSIIMMLFGSLYGIVDGIFISNFAGKTAFAGVNLIMPFLMLPAAVGIMFGTGGSALVSKKLGESKTEEANKCFSMIIWFMILFGILLIVLIETLIPAFLKMFDASDELKEIATIYGRIFATGIIFFMAQNAFNALYVTCNKSNLGLIMTIVAGVTNMVLDAILVGALKCGYQGAAAASVASQVVGGLFPLIFFSFKHPSSPLKISFAKFNFKWIGQAAFNGVSEFISNISLSIVNILYNYQLLKYFGENGVSAYGVIMYVGYIFVAIFMGFSLGISPKISYHYGAKDDVSLKSIFKVSLSSIIGISIILTIIAEALSSPLSYIFTGYDLELYNLTSKAYRIFCICYIFQGFNIFTSGLFTALNNGTISGIVSFVRTFVLQIICVFVMPIIFGAYGIFGSVIVAELLSALLGTFFIIKNKNKYHYFGKENEVLE